MPGVTVSESGKLDSVPSLVNVLPEGRVCTVKERRACYVGVRWDLLWNWMNPHAMNRIGSVSDGVLQASGPH